MLTKSTTRRQKVCQKLASAPLDLLPPRRVTRSKDPVAGQRSEIYPSYDYQPADPVDPVEGGSANAYDYVAADPINNEDLGGTHCSGKKYNKGKHDHWYCKAGRRAKAAGRWVYRHAEISAGGCLLICVGGGFQNGTWYQYRGVGCCFGGGNLGLSAKDYKYRSCGYMTADFTPGLGAYADSGVSAPSGNAWDVAGGLSYGLGLGIGYQRNIDMNSSYC